MTDPHPPVLAAYHAGTPIIHATGLADVMGCTASEAQQAVAEQRATGWLLPVWVAVPLRWTLDFAPLEPDPARPTAEARRHERDLAVMAWILDWWRHGYWPCTQHPQMLHNLPALSMPERTRRDHLARLRDTTRQGGPMLAEHGALCPAGAVTARAWLERERWRGVA